MDPLTLSVLAKPAAQLVSRLLKPVYSMVEKELSQQAQLAYHRLAGSYTDYLNNAVDRHSFFTSVVFKNEQRRLEDYYQPLTLIQSRDKHEIKIRDYPKGEIEAAGKIIIVDTAGMGKTTLLKHLFLHCVRQEAGIPIFIELRKLSKKRPLSEYILQQLSNAEGRSARELFFRLLSSGEFVFFLDGYDEIPEAERSEVTSSVLQFIEKTPGNKFILTSRDEVGLVAFSQFQRYTIKPLQKLEAYELLRKYSADSKLADSLIEKLNLPENRAIHEFLANPLLTSLLFKSFEYKHIIPLKRHIFYRQVYESLYEMHDLTKEGEYQRIKRSGLDIDRFSQVLRSFGALTYKVGKVEFTKEEALDFLTAAKKLAVEPKISASDMLHDLTHAVPLLVTEGNYIRWSHRSIQEYFAAQYICTRAPDKKGEILLQHYNAVDFSKHMNLILLCADIDRPAFDQSIGVMLAKRLLEHFETSYTDLEQTVESSLLHERRELTIGKISFFIRFQMDDVPQSDAAKSIHNRIYSACARRQVMATSLTVANPTLGFAYEKLGHFISEASARLALPFIVQNTLFKSLVVADVFDNTIDFAEICDSPDNFSNRIEYFLSINDLLKKFTPWRFDAAAARVYLDEVAEQFSAKENVEPW